MLGLTFYLPNFNFCNRKFTFRLFRHPKKEFFDTIKKYKQLNFVDILSITRITIVNLTYTKKGVIITLASKS